MSRTNPEEEPQLIREDYISLSKEEQQAISAKLIEFGGERYHRFVIHELETVKCWLKRKLITDFLNEQIIKYHATYKSKA